MTCDRESNSSAFDELNGDYEYVVANAGLDTDRGTTFGSAALGTYYVVLEIRYHGQHLLWNVRVDMKAGTNVLTLDQRNASPAVR
jgi:hypothetical protein